MITTANLILRNLNLKSSCRVFKSSSAAVNKRIPLITCKNNKLNLHLNDKKINSNSDEIVLASKGWQHYKSKSDWFTIHPTKSADDVLVGAEEFKNFNLNEILVRNLDEKHGITKATKIQVDCMKEIFNNQHVLLAAETGCGKVLKKLKLLIFNKIITSFRLTHF